MENKPRGRETNVTGQGHGLERRGEGLGTGPVGKQDGYQQRAQQNAPREQRTAPVRSSGRGGLLKYIILAVIVLGGGGGILGGLGGGSSQNQSSYQQQTQTQQTPAYTQQVNVNNIYNTVSSGNSSSGWVTKANTGSLDATVLKSARKKFTTIKGNNKDKVTVMVYMCGADLESRSGLGSTDIMEMCNATMGDNVNVILYAGGTTRWQNSIFSASTNQIYKIESGGVKCLSKDEGNVCMTTPSTLSGFIKYCSKNYPANRNMLIFWDHGGGSLSGYGYDEKFQRNGSMNLAGIDTALKDGGVKFDFVGFDACLMGTAETGLVLSQYADYMIASEEVESGYGWYYTNWLTNLSKNTSMATIEIGKQIVDDFVDYCAQKSASQKATLAITDLAELEATLPGELKDFALSTSEKIKSDYSAVADARNSCREFSTSSIDQVDLVNLAYNMGTQEGKDLAQAVLGAIKYNRCSKNMTNAYGLSIYFPYKKAGKVDTAVNTYDAIGLDEEYSDCIKAFASVASTAQQTQQTMYPQSTGGGSTILPGFYTSSSQGSSQSYTSTDLIMSILGTMLSNRSVITEEEASRAILDNSFDASSLFWTKGKNSNEILLSEEQWSKVRGLNLNVFYDDGEGYIDLGLDNVFTINEYGALQGIYDGTWLAIDGQVVAYYHMDTVDDGTDYTITGRVPALLNGDRVNLIIVFDNDNPYGIIAGANYAYVDGETETVGKNLVELEDGDKIDFLCDYYDYNGNYSDSYMLGDQYVVNGTPEISNVYLPDKSAAYPAYVFTDIFAQEYWTPIIP